VWKRRGGQQRGHFAGGARDELEEQVVGGTPAQRPQDAAALDASNRSTCAASTVGVDTDAWDGCGIRGGGRTDNGTGSAGTGRARSGTRAPISCSSARAGPPPEEWRVMRPPLPVAAVERRRWLSTKNVD
jgi:hypothetical protein